MTQSGWRHTPGTNRSVSKGQIPWDRGLWGLLLIIDDITLAMVLDW